MHLKKRGIQLIDRLRRNKNKENYSNSPRSLITFLEPNSIISEQFKTIRTNIHFTLPDTDVKKIVVTSSKQGEGKSTVAANLGVVFAQEGKKVLIVDADMRKPTLHFTFDLFNKRGLSNLLTKRFFVKEVFQDTFIYNLYVIPSGPIPPNPSELIASSNMAKLIKYLEEHFDIIIFDAPPILSVTDVQILANICDGTILVVSAGETEKADILKAKSTLLTSKANILGVILNKSELPKDNYYYHY